MKKTLFHTGITLLAALLLAGCNDDPDYGAERRARHDLFLNNDAPMLITGEGVTDLSSPGAKKVSTVTQTGSGKATVTLFIGTEDYEYAALTTPEMNTSEIDAYFTPGKKTSVALEYQSRRYPLGFRHELDIEIEQVKPLPEQDGIRGKRVWISLLEPNSCKTIFLIAEVFYQ
ncbi:hypothetical protein [Gallalistipes aquisgranensis]|mgnify:CR=1 FL=1|uniref:hypothetical protein n=1 Tax=Gallalistipes aquisgranensis TaxID=2779358 RepID=UPI001CF8A277|nr:hypothetical protein [Gallalistipes aquisgranensis]MBE5034052.1 hypothetical protein [Gallalistipes aquisgranensis]